MEIKAEEISQIIRKQIEEYDQKVEVMETGTVLTVGDGIARVYGLDNAMAGELLEFPDDVMGMVLNLEEDNVGVALFGDDTRDQGGRPGQAHRPHRRGARWARRWSAAWSTPWASPSTARAPSRPRSSARVEIKAPGIVERQPVNEPLQTGLKAIDSMIPIGRGQRELIIGDRQTGKTALAIDTIINQKGSDVICIYVAIGQKQSHGGPGGGQAARSTAPWSTPSWSSAGASESGAAAVHRPLRRLHHGRVLPRQRRARPVHLRRPVQARRGLPPALAAAAPPAGTRGLPGRRLLPALPAARARRQDERRPRAAAR